MLGWVLALCLNKAKGKEKIMQIRLQRAVDIVAINEFNSVFRNGSIKKKGGGDIISVAIGF